MTTMPDSNEQWLLDGLCQECRKQKYCSKPCKRAEVRREREIKAFIAEKTGMGEVMKALGVMK